MTERENEPKGTEETRAGAENGFPFRWPVPTRFSDVDVGGHAHHSHALVYFEEARTAYWTRATGRSDPMDVDYILAEVQVRYHARILYPQRLDVGVRLGRVGRKHFDLQYEILSEEGGRLASGHSVQVMYDYHTGRSVRLSAELVERLRAFEREGSPEA